MRVLKRGVCLTQKLNRPLACSYLSFLSHLKAVLSMQEYSKPTRLWRETLKSCWNSFATVTLSLQFAGISTWDVVKYALAYAGLFFWRDLFFFFRKVKNTSSSLPFRCWLKSPPQVQIQQHIYTSTINCIWDGSEVKEVKRSNSKNCSSIECLGAYFVSFGVDRRLFVVRLLWITHS